MANIYHTEKRKGKRHYIRIGVTPKSAKGKKMLARFKREAAAFAKKWEATFKKKDK
jgi:hypothetical protein